MTKICLRCKNDLPLDAFKKVNNTRCSHGCSILCLECLEATSPRERSKFEAQRYRRDNLEKVRASNYLCSVKRLYGIDPEEHKRIEEEQEKRCAICGAAPSGNKLYRRLAIDHSHVTGQVRGILCTSCNHGIARFEDSPELLKKAIDYLSKYPRA